MISARIPANENARLKALHDYRILDTQPEECFDDFTLLASQICETPISLISLIDTDRQWFKSKVGLEVKETHRDYAFCNHAIPNPTQTLVVLDALKDERFADNPLVKEDPNIRFYAGAPLVAQNGLAMGTLCIIDRVPREPSEEQITALSILSRRVVAQLELRRTSFQLAEALEKINILEGLLPICTYCRRIRNEDGTWSQVDEFIEQRSDMQFNHDICRGCLEIHYSANQPVS